MFLGWDPIFEYKGKTYAEMTKEDKVGIFHIKILPC
jgi:inosine triphosphate pyrophosphatase